MDSFSLALFLSHSCVCGFLKNVHVFVFNSVSLVDLLNKLATFTRAAAKLTGGIEGSSTTFGHLVLVLRDYDGGRVSAYFEDEAPGASGDVNELNAIRANLRRCFLSIRVVTMPQPTTADIQMMNGDNFEFDVTSEEVRSSAVELRKLLGELLLEPHMVSGREMCGPLLAETVQTIAHLVNSGAVDITLESAFQRAEARLLAKAVADLTVALQRVEDERRELPGFSGAIDPDLFHELVLSCLDELLQQYKDSTQHLRVQADIRTEEDGRAADVVSLRKASLIDHNTDIVTRMLEEAAKPCANWFRDNFRNPLCTRISRASVPDAEIDRLFVEKRAEVLVQFEERVRVSVTCAPAVASTWAVSVNKGRDVQGGCDIVKEEVSRVNAVRKAEEEAAARKEAQRRAEEETRARELAEKRAREEKLAREEVDRRALAAETKTANYRAFIAHTLQVNAAADRVSAADFPVYDGELRALIAGITPTNATTNSNAWLRKYEAIVELSEDIAAVYRNQIRKVKVCNVSKVTFCGYFV